MPHLNLRCTGQTLRAQVLESLSSLEREQVDDLARTALSSTRPQELEKALEEPGEELEFSLNAAGLDLPYPFIKKGGHLAALIWQARLGDKAAEKALLRYSEDDQHFLSLRVLQCSDWEPLTWQEARAKGVIKAFLEADFTKTGASPVAKGKGGRAKLDPKTLDLDAAKGAAQDWASEYYPHKGEVWQLMRQIQTLENNLQDLRKNRAQNVQIGPIDQPRTFWNQWLLQENVCRITRADSRAQTWPELFTSDQEWSGIHWQRPLLGFYQLSGTQSHSKSENCETSGLDSSILTGLERIRVQIAEHLDGEMVGQWMQKQVTHLAPTYPARGSANGDAT